MATRELVGVQIHSLTKTEIGNKLFPASIAE